METKVPEIGTELAEKQSRSPLTWALAIAILALNVNMMAHPWQMFSTLIDALFASLDVRQWTQMRWLVGTVVVVASLAAVRFGPDLKLALANVRAAMAFKRNALYRKQDRATVASPEAEYQERVARDREWRERAKKRHHFS